MVLAAHRGASYLAPEATRAAYILARDFGADLLELDVQRTRDGVLVVVHDANLLRTTDAAAVYASRRDLGRSGQWWLDVAAMDWGEIARLDAGTWFNRAHPERARASYRGLGILRLEDVIEIAEAGDPMPGLFLETKSALRYPGIEAQIVGLLTDRGWIRTASGGAESHPSRTVAERRVIFQSFVPASLDSFRRLAPEVPRVLLTERGAGGRSSITAAARLGAGWGPRALDLVRQPWVVAGAHRRGVAIYPWVFDEPWQMWIARVLGADDFFTNRIEVAVVATGHWRDVDVATSLRRMDEELGRTPARGAAH